jgi:phage terminase large subunit GpA-like protein
VVVADEVDRYPPSAGAEGDPLALAEKRTATFHNRKRIKVSTPTIKGLSRIDAAYEESDQRKFHVPCAHCEVQQVLVWGQVHWPEKEPENAAYFCPHCGVKWSERERIKAIRAGKWIASKPFKGIAGFHISELYSPWSTLGKMAVDFVNVKAFPERLKTWVNTTLGEVWEESTDSKDPEVLKTRAEDYDLRLVPAGALMVTAAVDVQGDRLELYIWGYGIGEEAWVLDYKAFHGDPVNALVWQQLLEYAKQPIEHELGAHVVPRTVAVDSGGHHTQEVYNFCRVNAIRRLPEGLQEFLAIKGQGMRGKPIMGKPTSQDIDYKGQRITNGVKLWPVGSSAGKELLYSRLNVDVPGAGYVHTTKALPEDFWDQLIAERLVTRYVRGYPTMEWQLPRGRRNEALDCAVYAYAAAVQLGLPRMRKKDWDTKRARLTVKREGAPETPAAVAAPAKQEAPPPAQEQQRRQQAYAPPRRSWVTGWRR